MKSRVRLALALLIVGVEGPYLQGQPTAAEILRGVVPSVIRWQAFWEGRKALPENYRPGAEVEARVIRTSTSYHIFLASIGLEVVAGFQVPRFGITSVGVTRTKISTNTEAVARFLKIQDNLRSSCASNARGTGATTDEKGVTTLGRPCPEAEIVLDDETHTFTTPELTPPDAIQGRVVPADVASIRTAVHKYMDPLRPTCGPIAARIPYYSNIDPWVWVFFEPTKGCRRGAATFSRAPDGSWEMGKFFADVPKEDLSGVISRISSNTAVMLTNLGESRTQKP